MKAYFNNSDGTLVEGFLPSDAADLSIDGKQVWGRPIGAGKLKRDLYPALSTRKRDYISRFSPGDVGEVHDLPPPFPRADQPQGKPARPRQLWGPLYWFVVKDLFCTLNPWNKFLNVPTEEISQKF